MSTVFFGRSRYAILLQGSHRVLSLQPDRAICGCVSSRTCDCKDSENYEQEEEERERKRERKGGESEKRETDVFDISTAMYVLYAPLLQIRQ